MPFPGDLPNPGIEPRSPALQGASSSTELLGKPYLGGSVVKNPSAKQENQVESLDQEDSLAEGNHNPLSVALFWIFNGQGAWQATVHGVVEGLGMT